jgi:hypothetical protein
MQQTEAICNVPAPVSPNSGIIRCQHIRSADPFREYGVSGEILPAPPAPKKGVNRTKWMASYFKFSKQKIMNQNNKKQNV